MTTDSVMLTMTKFVETLNVDNQFTRIEVLIDTKLYPNTFGINVRPIHLTLWSRVSKKRLMNMQDIIDIFNGICYIQVKESTHRRLSREPTMIVIDTTPKTYNEYTYYDYRVSKLFLLDELTRYQAVYESSHDVMKRYKERDAEINDMEANKIQGTELTE